jgi:hypothetical protein
MENKELNEFLNNSELVPMVFLGSKGMLFMYRAARILISGYSSIQFPVSEMFLKYIGISIDFLISLSNSYFRKILTK